MSEAPPSVPVQTVLTGKQLVTILMKDGTKVEVDVHLVAISKIGDYLTFTGDINQLVELACAKPQGWADTVDDDSLYELDRVARAINDPRAGRWLDRQKVAMTNLEPLKKKLDGLTK